MAYYPYLNDEQFLKDFDKELYREQFVRITALDFQTEKAIMSLEGKCTAGSCNLSGTSNMRRTASCTIVVTSEELSKHDSVTPSQYRNVTEITNLISMNKKVRMEIGFTNFTSKYTTYDKIWFPLGTFVIKSANVAKNNSGINISLTLNDKCALLNGDIGGVIPAATVFSELESFNSDGTQRSVEKILIKDVIKFLLVDYAGENPDNVLITDIDDYIVKVMKWNGRETLYLYERRNGRGNTILSLTNGLTGYADPKSFVKGQNIGYTIEPFVYPGVLECNAGETVASVLDKIRNTLGNFEWFYDVNGKFHFQQIKNYLNKSHATTILDISEQDYFAVANLSKSVYTFDENNKHLITSISNAPQYPNIKNDFVVWGTRKGATGIELPIKYHLAFDTKPTVSTTARLALVHMDYRGLQEVVPLVDNYEWGVPTSITEEKKSLFFISENPQQPEEPMVFKYSEISKGLQGHPEYTVCYLKVNSDDWRGELYYQGLWNRNKTVAAVPYAAELNAEWPKIWDPIKTDTEKTITITISSTSAIDIPVYEGGYKEDFSKNGLSYWLDFIEGTQGGSQDISQFNVNTIGRRTKVLNENTINSLFPEDFPNYIYIETSANIAAKEQKIARQLGREAIQVNKDIFKKMSVGGTKNAAFDRVKELLSIHTSYNESINLSIIPIYHLEPNTCISIYDAEIGVTGDYLIKTISLPLTPGGTSSISATRCAVREVQGQAGSARLGEGRLGETLRLG